MGVKDFSRGCRYALVLGALAALFLARVAGQALVAFAGATFLPPMEHWYSALLPYPVLLPMQVVILVLQAVMVAQVARDRGWFAGRGPRVGRVLIGISFVYFAVMAVRYVVTMALYPERRWFGPGTIPVAFHFVLAAYLCCYGRYLRGRAPGAVAEHGREPAPGRS